MITTRNWWYVTTRISRWQKSSDDYHTCSVDWVSDSVLDMVGCMNHDHWKWSCITTGLMMMTMTNLICSMDWRSGLSPPWQQKIFSSTMAATGRLRYFSSVLHFLFSIFKTNIFLVKYRFQSLPQAIYCNVCCFSFLVVKCSQWWQKAGQNLFHTFLYNICCSGTKANLWQFYSPQTFTFTVTEKQMK